LVLPTDTGETLYRKLEQESVKLFIDSWPDIAAGVAPRIPQAGSGTHYRTSDRRHLDRIELDKTYRAAELINILRATTFPPYRGAYFEVGGRKIYLRLELEAEENEDCK
jgi:methionyl-tRNA formyltransferase